MRLYAYMLYRLTTNLAFYFLLKEEKRASILEQATKNIAYILGRIDESSPCHSSHLLTLDFEFIFEGYVILELVFLLIRETVNIKELANLTANSKNHGQITLNTKLHSASFRSSHHSALSINSCLRIPKPLSVIKPETLFLNSRKSILM